MSVALCVLHTYSKHPIISNFPKIADAHAKPPPCRQHHLHLPLRLVPALALVLALGQRHQPVLLHLMQRMEACMMRWRLKQWQQKLRL